MNEYLERAPKRIDRMPLSEAEINIRARDLAFVISRLDDLEKERVRLKAKVKAYLAQYKTLLLEMDAEVDQLLKDKKRLIQAVRFGSEEADAKEKVEDGIEDDLSLEHLVAKE